MKEIRSILATDCGSTTTKCILIEKIGDTYRQTIRGEAPTTVEAPFEDVTMGVINAVTEVEELSRQRLTLSDGAVREATPTRRFLRQVAGPDGGEQWEIIVPQEGDEGVDAYISTSSAGGGLQMMVAGVVASMTGESAQRAALGAGAIVMDVIASNDGRLPHEKIDRIRRLRPDMILLAGGTDGGSKLPLDLAELIAAAKPRPRLGQGFNLPIIYAGNNALKVEIHEILAPVSALTEVDNLRPVLERENLNPARDKIHDLFMEHVMQQAPGYDKLMGFCRYWDDSPTGGGPVQVPIMPTPGAVGKIIEKVAEIQGINVVGVDIGGATTDVFSVFGGVFNRTVSANLGMSYSVSNVLAEAGLENIQRWVPFPLDPGELRNRIGNKMIRPTTIPQTMEDLLIEQAIAREALRLSFVQHKEFAVELKGVQQERTISDAFDQDSGSRTLVKMMELDLLVGSGGVLSHAPRRVQGAWMLVDSFLPEGFTRLAVDSIFMMPQLGVLASFHETAATQVFDKDCLIYLGTCVAPLGRVKNPGKPCLRMTGELPSGPVDVQIPQDELRLFPLGPGEEAALHFQPEKGFDLGAGPGKEIRRVVLGGVAGLIIDTRGRPFSLAADTPGRLEKLARWDITKK
ncbi:MAG: glutamate mutase L [Candidatus Delongbacteria bacterium]